MSAVLVTLLFFLSGASGLIYQVVWVRQFGNLFGNTVFSAAAVSGVFLCGLGVGSYLTGRWIDRRRGDPRLPLRAYGAFELGIALLGLGIALVLPRLEPLSASLSSYVQGSDGWYAPSGLSHVLRYAMAVLLLAPITLPMGGTLTLLIRHFVAPDVARAGWRIGVLYGTNTAGAALGAFLTDFALVPGLGIQATQGAAIALNAVAGLGALALAGRGPLFVAAVEPAQAAAPAGPTADARAARWTALALFASGVTAMGLQIVWLRYLTGVVGSYRAVFSLLLTVVLVGIWLGSLLGGWLERRLGRPALLYAGVQTAMVAVALAQLAAFDALGAGAVSDAAAGAWAAAEPGARAWLEAWLNLRPILLLVAAPALLMGCAYPLANAHVQRAEAALGRRAGALYLANTLGNVTGSFATGFLLLPLLGIQNSVGVLAAVAVAAVLALTRSCEPDTPDARVGRPVGAACALGLAAAVGGWALLPAELLLAPSVPRDFAPGQRVLAVSEGIQETVAVLERPGIERRLFTNGHSMSSSHRYAQRYMRLFAHLPLLAMESPRSVVVVCFGVGNTLHAASLHPSVDRIHAVDLSRNVVSHGGFFAATNGGVLEDPRVSVYLNDGRQHLRMQAPGTYDLVTLEPPPISYAGVAALYSREFYALAKSRLRPRGAVTQWLPAYQVDAPANRAIVRAFLDVFPQAVLLSGWQSELILYGTRDGAGLDLPRVLASLRERPAVAADLAAVDVETPTALVGSFAGGPEALHRATEGVAPVSDDHPVMEYSVRSRLFRTEIPADFFDVSGVAAWCPGCFDADGEPVPEVVHLDGHLAALAPWYASEAFRIHTSRAIGEPPAPVVVPDTPEVQAAIRASAYLRSFLRPTPGPLAAAH